MRFTILSLILNISKLLNVQCIGLCKCHSSFPTKNTPKILNNVLSLQSVYLIPVLTFSFICEVTLLR